MLVFSPLNRVQLANKYGAPAPTIGRYKMDPCIFLMMNYNRSRDPKVSIKLFCNIKLKVSPETVTPDYREGPTV